jgi:hypothetical protein
MNIKITNRDCTRITRVVASKIKQSNSYAILSSWHEKLIGPAINYYCVKKPGHNETRIPIYNISYISIHGISPIHTFQNIPALYSKRSVFLVVEPGYSVKCE